MLGVQKDRDRGARGIASNVEVAVVADGALRTPPQVLAPALGAEPGFGLLGSAEQMPGGTLTWMECW